MPERKLNGKDPLHQAIIIGKQLSIGRRLARNPDTRAKIEKGISNGKSDIEIAASLGVDNPLLGARALRTTRWQDGTDTIPSRTPEQDRENLLEGGQLWREAHPDLQVDHQRKAADGTRRALTGKQVKYTTREIDTVRQVLEQGGSYQEAAQRLSEAGVPTTVKQVKDLAGRFQIPYRRHQIITSEIRQVEDQVLEAAVQGKGRRQILDELGGKHRATVRQTLSTLGVRDRIDWNASTPIGGKTRRQLALEIRQQSASTAAAHQQFNALLERHNLPPVTLSAFSSIFPDGFRKRK